MALLTASFRHTKADLVKKNGVGDDLPFNFFGWKHNALAVTAQMDHDSMNLDLFERFEKSFNICYALRKYWNVNEITMVAEGFLSYDPIATSGKNLRDAFIKNKNVSECITLAHAFSIDGDPKLTVVAMPYKYKKKEILWDTMIATPNEASKLFRESVFPAMLIRCVSEGTREEFSEEEREEAAQRIADEGFSIYDFSGEGD